VIPCSWGLSNAYLLKEPVELFIFTTPIGLHSNDFSIKLALNKLLKIKKDLINIRTLLEQINPSKFTEIIYKAYIISVLANRGWCRTPYIRKH
jgi:hypothetical protein